jgi:hypothetical protein
MAWKEIIAPVNIFFLENAKALFLNALIEE